ncbi:MAG: cobalt-precorrin-5B (C(1))-methyltransferase [Deltaproteobacteria bacterium]|nr:cobalt-precorrin-5B (C(1))-methyltransferase [Deltaproteobacteria bacterium]
MRNWPGKRGDGKTKTSRGKKRLRHGFTTGSAATAAAKAALLSLLGKKVVQGKVDIPLPEEGRLTIPIDRVGMFDGYARATVIKNGGDDPDATHRARISCTVLLKPGGHGNQVLLRGGKGVGRVTKPGLPIPPGEPAINPGPRKQLQKAVQECFLETGTAPMGLEITIEVADGEKIARKTLNSRLGIVGGISILGTRGTVIPFSHEAYEGTITLSLDVAEALGLETVALCTGGKSEKFLQALFPELPEEASIQVADFFAFSLKEAAQRRFSHIIYGCFFGKLIKVAQGHEYTHAGRALIDFRLLAEWCKAAGINGQKAGAVVRANTAREVLDIISHDTRKEDVIQTLIGKAVSNGRCFIPPKVCLEVCLFGFDGTLLGRRLASGEAHRQDVEGQTGDMDENG